jgi:hypothetical protein
METYNLSLVKSDDFKTYLNQPLDVNFSESIAVASVITKITDLNSYSPLERSAFSVELQTTGDMTRRPQGIYRINHPVKKGLDVFLVPIGIDNNGMKYEAVFS